MTLSLCVACIHSFRKIIDTPYTMEKARLHTTASTLLNIHSTSTGTCMALHLRTFKCEEFKGVPHRSFTEPNISGRFSTCTYLTM